MLLDKRLTVKDLKYNGIYWPLKITNDLTGQKDYATRHTDIL